MSDDAPDEFAVHVQAECEQAQNALVRARLESCIHDSVLHHIMPDLNNEFGCEWSRD